MQQSIKKKKPLIFQHLGQSLQLINKNIICFYCTLARNYLNTFWHSIKKNIDNIHTKIHRFLHAWQLVTYLSTYDPPINYIFGSWFSHSYLWLVIGFFLVNFCILCKKKFQTAKQQNMKKTRNKYWAQSKLVSIVIISRSLASSSFLSTSAFPCLFAM